MFHFQVLRTIHKTLYSANNRNLSKQILTLDEIFSKMSDTTTVKKLKYDGRSKKRQWEDRRSDKGEGLNSIQPKQQKVDGSETTITEKVKRKKFVLLMGYSGVNYYGMQRNPKMQTIEEELFKALLKTNLINEESFNQVQQMQFQRAARTDKGVSAVRQIVSMKLSDTIDLNQLNGELPETIRVFAYKRVTKGFNSKSQCDSRTYTYLLPTVAFADQKSEVTQKDFKLTEDLHNQINDALSHYVGTKNFHNFTLKKKPNDPSAKRYIKSFICEQPFVREGVEFAILKVHGQSFMMHQIRKMIGLILAIIRGQATLDIIKTSFASEKVNIPRAPGLGLVLDYVHYDRYNDRYGNDGMHEKLTWDHVQDEVNSFKEQYIYPTIIKEEVEKEGILKWVKEKLSRHSYTDAEEKEDNESDNDGDDDDETTDYDLVKNNNSVKVNQAAA